MNKKTIVITGSTRGLGFGLAKEFLESGHQVVLNGRTEDKVTRAVTGLQKTGVEVTGVTGNVTDEITHYKLLERATDTFGGIDIWINNAGIPQPYEELTGLDIKEISHLLDTNIYGLVLGTKIAVNHMLKQGSGKIFNMEGFGSDGRTMKKLTIYGTTKRAVNYFTKSLAKELAGSPVQIGILSPGMVRTDFIKAPAASGSEDEQKRFKKVYDVLAEDVDVVSKFLVARLLKSQKNYDRIEYLTKTKLVFKMLKMLVR